MKLKLPIALLAALFVCMNTVHAEETSGSTTTTVYASPENTYMATISGSGGTSLGVNAANVTWNQSYDFPAGTPISVGSVLAESTLNVVTPEGAKEETVVRTSANMFIGGWGWGVNPSDGLAPNSGTVYVGKNATLEVGSAASDASTNQLNIGSSSNYAETGVEGTMIVDGGTVRAGNPSVGLSWNSKGTLKIINGGTLVAENKGNDTGVFAVGYYGNSSGTVIVDESSSLVAEYYTIVGYGRDGKADATLEVNNNSTADFGDYLYVGRENSSTGELKVNGSSVEAGTTYLGYGAGTSGTVSLNDGATSTITGTTNIGYNGGEGSFSVSEGSTATFEEYVMVGGWNGSSGELTVAEGGTVEVQSALYLGYAAGTSGDVAVAGEGSTLAVAGTNFVGYSGTGTVNISEGADVVSDGQLVIGYQAASTGTVTVDGEGSNLTATGSTFLGYSENLDNTTANSGKLELKNGASADLQYVQATGSSVVSVTGGSTAKVGNELTGLYIGENAQLIVEDAPAVAETGTAAKSSSLVVTGILESEGTVTADLTEGGSIKADSVNNIGEMNVTLAKDASFDAGFAVQNTGTMNVSVSDQASYEADIIQNSGTAKVTLADGGSMTAGTVENLGTDSIMEVTVGSGSTYKVTDSMENTGTATVTLAEGSNFETAKVENNGTMTVTVDKAATYTATTVENTGTLNMELKEGSSMKVGTYVNASDSTSTITAAENATCEIANIDLSGGNLRLEGDGEFDLGASSGGLSSEFYVSDLTTTTHIDFSSLATAENLKFSIDKESVFTLNFNATALADIGQDEQKTFTLTLVIGYDGFTVDEETLAYLLTNNTYYNFESVSETAEGQKVSAGATDYVVSDAEYAMFGNKLVWTGTVTGIPEPTTVTLSLLALTALAARRRRRA